MKKLLLAFAFLLCITHLAIAQEPSLRLGGLEMRIGMAQTKVMDYLLKYYEVKQFSRTDSYLIYERKLNQNDEYKSVGQAAFDKGKLTYAVKDWYSADVGTGYKLVDVLHAVLTQLEQNGETVATIETGVIREPDATVQNIKLSFGKKWVTITMSDYKGSKNVQVTETIRFAPFPK